MYDLVIRFGQGRHLPYMKRGRKKLTITNIVKKIREKKRAVAIVVLYLILDYAQDGVIDGSPLWTLGQFWASL